MHHHDIKVVCEGESVVVSTSIFLAFSDFEEWIRCRFGIDKTKRIAFQDQSGKEIIPSLRQIDGKRSSTQEICVVVLKNPEPKAEVKISWVVSDFLSPSFLYPVVILAYFIAIFASSENPLGPKNLFRYVSPIFTFLRVGLEHQDKLYADMYAAFVTWPVTYFYIRRALNPENGILFAFKKYGTDTFFGALAATMVVVLRHYIRERQSASLQNWPEMKPQLMQGGM